MVTQDLALMDRQNRFPRDGNDKCKTWIFNLGCIILEITFSNQSCKSGIWFSVTFVTQYRNTSGILSLSLLTRTQGIDSQVRVYAWIMLQLLLRIILPPWLNFRKLITNITGTFTNTHTHTHMVLQLHRQLTKHS